MRKRVTLITDIVVLIVADEDGIMPQTIEEIAYAQKAKVPIIVLSIKLINLMFY